MLLLIVKRTVENGNHILQKYQEVFPLHDGNIYNLGKESENRKKALHFKYLQNIVFVLVRTMSYRVKNTVFILSKFSVLCFYIIG